MTASAVGYEQVRAWVEVMLGQTHATVVRTTAWIVLRVLVAQRVTAAALARALPADQSGKARARLTRVRRWWTGPPLEQTVVSPQLIQAALTLLPPGQSVVVALDTTRLGPWEVWLVGIVVQGRTVPIGWAAIPYSWPKGRFRTTTVALLQRLQHAFPPVYRGAWSRTGGFRVRCSSPTCGRPTPVWPKYSNSSSHRRNWLQVFGNAEASHMGQSVGQPRHTRAVRSEKW